MHDGAGRFAGTLTRTSLWRRISGAAAMCAPLLLIALPAVAAGTAGAPPEYQPVEDIVAAAEDYLRGRIAATDRDLVPRAGNLDPRLRLPHCSAGLEGYLPAGARIRNRTVVGVRCPGSHPWKVYVPVDVLELRTVLVARRTLPRDHVLTAADLVAEERDVSGLMGGYVADAERIVGLRLTRRVASGSVLAPSMLEQRVVVQRGQSVTLVAKSDALTIRMAGLALADGAVDERIRVRNKGSDRVVEGVVRSAQQVEVLMQ